MRCAAGIPCATVHRYADPRVFFFPSSLRGLAEREIPAAPWLPGPGEALSPAFVRQFSWPHVEPLSLFNILFPGLLGGISID